MFLLKLKVTSRRSGVTSGVPSSFIVTSTRRYLTSKVGLELYLVFLSFKCFSFSRLKVLLLNGYCIVPDTDLKFEFWIKLFKSSSSLLHSFLSLQPYQRHNETKPLYKWKLATIMSPITFSWTFSTAFAGSTAADKRRVGEIVFDQLNVLLPVVLGIRHTSLIC